MFLYDEAFTRTHAVGFTLIWTALAIYAAESLWWSRKKRLHNSAMSLPCCWTKRFIVTMTYDLAHRIKTHVTISVTLDHYA